MRRWSVIALVMTVASATVLVSDLGRRAPARPSRSSHPTDAREGASLLRYAGFVGGSTDDGGTAIAVDSTGSAYLAGYATSDENTFPDGNGLSLPGPDNTHNGSTDAFVAKIDPSGTRLLYAGFIGGSGDDVATGIAVDAGGSAFVVGYTTSDENTFPDGDGMGTLAGPDSSHNGAYDAFVVKINPTGEALQYAGFIGGDESDRAHSVAVDPSGAAYLGGSTDSTTTFPDGDGFGQLGGADHSQNGDTDGFVTKLDPDGTLSYATFVGGSGIDDLQGVAVDGTRSAYIAGTTSSTEATFPDGGGMGSIPGPDPTHNGGDPASANEAEDAFIAKLNPSGTGMVYAGFIGGSGEDQASDVDVDRFGGAYVVGSTTSESSSSTAGTFPDGDGFGTLVTPDSSPNGSTDAFVARVEPNGHALSYAGFIGGSLHDFGSSIAVDGSGSAHVAGFTPSVEDSFPDGDGIGTLPGSDPTYNGWDDGFLARIQSSGRGFHSAGYIGGNQDDYIHGLALDADANAYLAGLTSSSDSTFPDGDGFGGLAGPDQSRNEAAGVDAFVAKVEVFPPLTRCRGEVATQVGSPSRDVLIGTHWPDVISGEGGNDRIRGGGGADLVCGGRGGDRIAGNGGPDRLYGDAGRDRISGGGGKDRLVGGPGNDRTIGGGGRDRCSGGPGKDEGSCERGRV